METTSAVDKIFSCGFVTAILKFGTDKIKNGTDKIKNGTDTLSANRLAYTEKTFVLHETTACPTRHFWLSYTALLTFLHEEKGVFTRLDCSFRFWEYWRLHVASAKPHRLWIEVALSMYGDAAVYP